MDLYIKDFGSSQIDDLEYLEKCRKKMSTFYMEFLLPLYKPLQNNKKFKFSVLEEELTCRIMLEDLKKHYKLNNVREVLNKVSENKPTLTSEKIDKIIEAMKNLKSSK